MTNFTQKQQAYIDNRAAGMKQKESAVAAGYSAPTAEKQACTMERTTAIKEGIAKAKRALKSNGADVKDDDGARPMYAMPKKVYACSKEFLLDAMNHPLLPIAARAEYAKSLLQYQHARVAEKTKKDSAKDAAAVIAAGGKVTTAGAKRHKFGKKAPPREHRTSLN